MQIIPDATNAYLIEFSPDYDPEDESTRVYELLKVVAWVVCDDRQIHGLTLWDLEDSWNESRKDGEIWTSSMHDFFVGYQVGDGKPSDSHIRKALDLYNVYLRQHPDE